MDNSRKIYLDFFNVGFLAKSSICLGDMNVLKNLHKFLPFPRNNKNKVFNLLSYIIVNCGKLWLLLNSTSFSIMVKVIFAIVLVL